MTVFSLHEILPRTAPRGAQRRPVLTATSLGQADVTDRFVETILDLHWREIARFLGGGDGASLREFDGITIGGHTLVSDPDAIVAWLRGDP